MQAVILAGGLGTRLRPLTERTPKPMVEAGGRPFLEYIVEHLAQQGFERLLLLVGYLGRHITEHFGDGKRFGVAIDYAWEPAPLGTAGALRNAAAQLAGSFLVLYGDSFLPIDYRLVSEAFLRSGGQGLIVVYDNRIAPTGVPNNVALHPDGRVARYAKGRGGNDLAYVEAGALCLRREVVERLPASQPVSLEEDVYPRLIRDGQLHSLVTRQRFFDIGTPERLSEFASARA